MTNTLNSITVSLQAVPSEDAGMIQLRAFCLNANERVNRSQADYIHPTNNSITVDLRSVPEDVAKIVFIVTLSDTQRSFGETTAVVQMVGIGIP